MCAVPSMPAARIPSKVSLRPSALISVPTTFAPPAAHFWAMSLPNPLPAPVTMTTLPARYFDIVCPPFQSYAPSRFRPSRLATPAAVRRVLEAREAFVGQPDDRLQFQRVQVANSAAA